MGIIYLIILWGLRKIKIKRFDDKFVNGFMAGIIAFLLTSPIGFAAVFFNFAELGLSDFAGILTLGKVPEGMAENIFATLVDLMVSGALGIIFAYLVPYIGSRYLWFKGWFLLGAFWYVYSPVIAVSMLNNEININVQTHVINGMIAGLFGIILAQAYYLLHRDIQRKSNNNNFTDARKNYIVGNEFAEEIAAPIAEPPFAPAAGTSPPAAPVSLMATPDRWTNTPQFEVAWTNPAHHGRIVGAHYKLSAPPHGNTDGKYVTDNPFTLTATEAEQHVYIWLQDEQGRTAYQNAAFITFKYDPVEPTWPPGKALKVTKVMADRVKFEWPAAIEDNKDIRYKVLLNGVSVGETADTTFIVSNLEPSTNYTFSIVAEDEAGNTAEFPRPKKVKTRRVKK